MSRIHLSAVDGFSVRFAVSEIFLQVNKYVEECSLKKHRDEIDMLNKWRSLKKNVQRRRNAFRHPHEYSSC